MKQVGEIHEELLKIAEVNQRSHFSVPNLSVKMIDEGISLRVHF
jgi:hypothetical protein